MNEIHLFSDIDEYALASVKLAIDSIYDETPDDKDLIINIASYGGEFLTGVAIIDCIREKGFRTTANILGVAASTAAIIALSCDKVKMSPLGSIMIHSAFRDDGVKDEGIARCNALQMDIIKKRCSSFKDSDLKKDNWISAAQALEMGLIDEITQGEIEYKSFCNRIAACFNIKGVSEMEDEKKEVVEQIVEEKKEDEEMQAEGEDKSVMDVLEELANKVSELMERVSKLESPAALAEDEEEKDKEKEESDEQARANAIYKKLCRPKSAVPVSCERKETKVFKANSSFKDYING